MNEEGIADLDYFVDLQPKKEDFHEAVLRGLSLPQKAISPKFFYDEKGSKIFDKICEAPEYYVTRTEIAILNDIKKEIYSVVEPGSVVVDEASLSLIFIFGSGILDVLSASVVNASVCA